MALICGIKLTHDGTVALVDGNRLVFSYEQEKLANAPRYSVLEDLSTVASMLADAGYEPGQIDTFVVDGWGDGEATPRVRTLHNGAPIELGVAPYKEKGPKSEVLERARFDRLPIGGSTYPYASYPHAAGHVVSGYVTSPFAQRGADAYVLAWDGGMLPRLYFVDAAAGTIRGLGPILTFMGNVYAGFAKYFPPFQPKSDSPEDLLANELTIPGKVMAYTALGDVQPALLPVFEEIYDRCPGVSRGFADVFAHEFLATGVRESYTSAEILASFQMYLGNLLLEALRGRLARERVTRPNICLTGGCALNIKWNSLLRNSGLFGDVYVPPFPNDTGSALGAACAEMIRSTGRLRLDWDVYSGPALRSSEPAAGWAKRACGVGELAELLHDHEPVVFFEGNAELGPRALGNRSILASPVSTSAKQTLNRIKDREDYRPVSPICLEHRAPAIFSPGTPDPYMLFEHQVRPDWTDRIPGVLHLDGSARLQTVNERQHPTMAALLTEFEKLSGVPVLCNTSANHNGRGFFPDVASATAWGKTNHVWAEGVLYSRIGS